MYLYDSENIHATCVLFIYRNVSLWSISPTPQCYEQIGSPLHTYCGQCSCTSGMAYSYRLTAQLLVSDIFKGNVFTVCTQQTVNLQPK